MRGGDEMAEDPTPGKTSGGRFAPGNRLGRGRREGSRNKATLVLEKLMDDEGVAIVRKVIEAAKGGDMRAIALVLDRILPPRKGRAVKFDLPEIETAADVGTAVSAVIRAMADGDLTPEEAQVVVSVLDVKHRAAELDEIADRLARLEADRGTER